jgi:DNA-binding CsgD family transcriptional regulator/PAS domain-containing protein
MIGLDGTSAQALSEAISAIYDCALDPQQWPATCRRIADLCESTAGGICVHDIQHVQNDQLLVFGYQPEFLEKLGKHYSHLSKLLSPHICRALAISDALDIRTLRSEMLERTLDGLVAGVFLTARDGRVVYMNAAAERQIKTGSAIRIVNNRISPTDAAARAALSKAIDEASRDDTDTDASECSMAIPDSNGTGYIATLLPVERGQRRGILAPFAASVAVFTKDSVQAPLMPGEAFARLYKLTDGELRVLLALAQGLGAIEVADMLGISEPTVRSHLKHIFAKTDAPRQADLLRLLHNATPPIRAPQPSAHAA